MSDDPDDTGKKQRAVTLFKPGQSGNPAGRPKGSRNKLQDEFITDYLEAWMAFGRQALFNAAVTDPVGFVKVAASLLPRAVSIAMSVEDKRNATDWNRDELVALLRDARNGSGGTDKADRRDREPDSVH